MNRKTLVMVATLAGLVMMVALLIFPIAVTKMGDKSMSTRAIEGGSGPWLLLFSWIACGFCALVCLKKADYIGLAEDRCRMLSLLGFKLGAFFFLALLIAGTRGDSTSWGFGFWLGFVASIVGAFTVYLTFNEKLAQKIASKAKELGSDEGEGGGSGGGSAGGGDAPSAS
jgi:hypothetical protein